MGMVEKHLPKRQFDSVIRLIKTSPLDRVKAIKTATFQALKRLKIKRDVRHARKTLPKGSDQGDVRSIVVWLEKIKPGDKKAIDQLIAIDATCCRRVGGK